MRATVARVWLYVLGVVSLISAMSDHVHAAAAAAAPEIDGGTVSAGLAGLTAAVLILRSRRRSK
jgi:hypothetical protein